MSKQSPFHIPKPKQIKFPGFTSFSMPDVKSPYEFARPKQIKPAEFKPFSMPRINFVKIEPIDNHKIRTRVPKTGETFEEKSSSSFVSYSNNNGVEKAILGGTYLENANGKVNEAAYDVTI